MHTLLASMQDIVTPLHDVPVSLVCTNWQWHAHVIVNHITTFYFLKDKIHDAAKYREKDTPALNDIDLELDDLVEKAVEEVST